ncbi:hypothetical protein ASG73_04095 [Janibacter sp. Soil728]|uniref:DUF4333 domain-containing protein n=1 Tax=Janibacter sp. Soil728 TaxID=1736393 RepID=UPI0006FF2D68|nr:DUF4333 domain-containing protein [Janibacter sp. Soil728]KRE39500.1 hypothetical protein ASG73_04095 [Janibacter sp. Soil728]
MRVVPAASLALVAAALLTGCGSDGDQPDPGSTQTVTPADVTGQAERLIGPKMPEGSTLHCPEALAAQVDATTTCTWSIPDGSSIGMTVTVTQIVEDTASLNFTNDDSVTPSPTS